MSLIVHDTISLTTSSGVSSIQLCIGDITKLSKEEQVDVLVVSAFPGEVRCKQRRSTRPQEEFRRFRAPNARCQYMCSLLDYL